MNNTREEAMEILEGLPKHTPKCVNKVCLRTTGIPCYNADCPAYEPKHAPDIVAERDKYKAERDMARNLASELHTQRAYYKAQRDKLKETAAKLHERVGLYIRGVAEMTELIAVAQETEAAIAECEDNQC